MNRINLLPADTYIVVNKTILSEYDRKLVLMLYQPLIGSLSVSLYFTLWSYLDKQEILSCEWTHHHLMSSLGIKLDSILEAREKLEAIGLLKTYYKKANQVNVDNYIYELYSPVSAQDFFVNPLLNTGLYSVLGKTEYQKLKSYFELPKIDLKDYTDITMPFTSIFTVSDDIIINDLDDIRKHSTRSLEIISQLDLNFIFATIPKEIFNIRAVTNEIKELLYKLSFIYALDNQTMIELIKMSLSDKGIIDKDNLQKNCRNYYRFEHDGKLPNLAHQNQPEYLRKTGTDISNKNKMIYTFETTTPADFIGIKNGGVITNSDREILSYLLIDLNLKPGVVNVLIDYVLRINNNKLIKKYIEQIALQWKRSNIETVEQAMQLAKENIKGKEKRKVAVYSENKPQWLDKKIEKREATKEEKALMVDMLKDYK
ncbi:MAG: DnaD domain protein [Bacilli bacterium]|nr:DnaD domain protein [Bacilli bacterium]